MPYGVNVNQRTAAPAQGATVDTSRWFVASKAGGDTSSAQGPLTSLVDLQDAVGAQNTGNTPVYDALDLFWREGGGEAFLGSYASDYHAGLSLFSSRLGSGQVSVIGENSDSALYGAVAGHCQNYNRVGILDVGNGDSVSAMQAKGDALPTDQTGEYVALFGSWLTAPAAAGGSGSTPRQIPASALVAALCRRVDRAGNPNRAPAGLDYPAQYSSGVVYNPTDDEIQALLDHGVNPIVDDGVIWPFLALTPIPQSSVTPFWQLNCARARMWLKAQAKARGKYFMNKPLDSLGHTAGALKLTLNQPFMQLYSKDGLFGDTAADAFNIDVSKVVNNTDTASTAKLVAVAQAVFALGVAEVDIDLVSVPVGGAIS